MAYKQLLMRFHALILLFLCSALTTPAAQTIPFTVYLSGDQVVPSNSMTLGGTGLVTLTASSLVVDIHIEETYRNRPVHVRHEMDPNAPVNQRQWHVTINGPARPDTNALVLFNLGICGAAAEEGGFSPANSGTGTISKPGNTPRPPRPPPSVPVVSICALNDVLILSPETQRSLMSGLLYVEAEGFGGHIRGQILPTDSDGDGVPDYLDQCPNTSPESLVAATVAASINSLRAMGRGRITGSSRRRSRKPRNRSSRRASSHTR